MSYIILSGDQRDVQEKVRHFLSIGFNLQGSISVVLNPSNNKLHLTQPMYHPESDLIRTLHLRFNSNGLTATHGVFVVHNSRKLQDLLQNFEGDKSRWIHCKLSSDMSQDVFVLDEQEAFNEFNIKQGFNLKTGIPLDGGRRSKTSRRRL